ncbi:MAG: mechanosensitive ion channel family protein [Desulfobulbaceae bacterium]|nr:MAG: mechanosensitive ion channel family protein [Desulfobulbaceae bacterium]
MVDMERFAGLAGQSGAILLIFAAGFLAFLVLRRGLERLGRRGVISQPFFHVSKNIMRWLLIITVVAATFQQLGVKVTNIVTTLLTVAGMIAIGFIAVWSVLSNILCSMMLVMFRNFDMGDEVELIEPVGGTGLKGTVVGFNIMFTTLAENGDTAEAGMLTQVPNNLFFQKSLRRKKGTGSETLGQYLLTKPIKAGTPPRA